MLTADLVKPRIKSRQKQIVIDWLPPSPDMLSTADALLKRFAAHVGKPRGMWEQALEDYIGARVDYVVVRGLAKVIEDAAAFTPIPLAVDPADVRRLLFGGGAVFERGDLFHQRTRADALQAAAAQFDLTPDAVERALFADRAAEYLLTDVGQTWTPADLIGRYNLELARGVLYWSSQMRVQLHDGYKDFWRYLKLFKLMFEAAPLPDGGYHVMLEGAISPFVRQTTRYGRQFAAFLPALFLGERWSMVADVHLPGWTAEYRLDSKFPLKSHFRKSGLYDSALEADFAAEFAAKFGGSKRDGWLLQREDELIVLGDTVMIPDFSVTHARDGRRCLIEIVGYWHPDYLRRKVAKVRAAGRSDLILLVYEGVNLAQERLQDVPGEVVYFSNKPVLKDVLAAVEKVAK
jgi:predicted nuclease of restriction endonuclease-like RecB superfamily